MAHLPSFDCYRVPPEVFLQERTPVFFLPLEDSFALQIVIEDLQLSIDKAEEGTCTIVRKMANFANEHGTPITL